MGSRRSVGRSPISVRQLLRARLTYLTKNVCVRPARVPAPEWLPASPRRCAAPRAAPSALWRTRGSWHRAAAARRSWRPRRRTTCWQSAKPLSCPRWSSSPCRAAWRTATRRSRWTTRRTRRCCSRLPRRTCSSSSRQRAHPSPCHSRASRTPRRCATRPGACCASHQRGRTIPARGVSPAPPSSAPVRASV